MRNTSLNLISSSQTNMFSLCILSAALALAGCGGGESASVSGAQATLSTAAAGAAGASTDASAAALGAETDSAAVDVALADTSADGMKQAQAVRFAATAPTSVVGINLPAPVTWASFPMYTDAIREARQFEQVGGGAAALDAEGWPTTDFRVVLYEGGPQPWVYGKWAGSFTGRATVGPLNQTTISDVVYNAATNTTTFSMNVASNVTSAVGFTVTGTTGGVKNISMRRPADISAPATTFRAEATSFYNKFGYVRYMWFQDAWSDTKHTSWSTRTTSKLRTGPGYQNGQGRPLEDAIAFSNAAKTGGWFHIPINADDDYVTQTAIMLRDKLTAGLPIYIELGNEIWNGVAPLQGVSVANALAHVAANPGVLNFDGDTNQYSLADRWVAMRTKEISTLFQAAFGSAYASRVRIVLANQPVWTRLSRQLEFVNKRFGPPSNYFYAISTAPYVTLNNGGYGGTNDTNNTTLTSDQAIAGLMLNSKNALDWGQLENTFITAKRYGLSFVAYEGGPALSDGFAQGTPGVKAAQMAPGMQAVVKDLLNRSFDAGMSSFAFFEGGVENNSAFGARFSLSDSVDALVKGTAPKAQALLSFLKAGKPAPTRNVVAGPGSVIDGRAYADKQATGAYPKLSLGTWQVAPMIGQQGNLPYVINCTAPGTYTLKLNVTTTGSSTTNIEVNGKVVKVGAAIPNTNNVAADVTLGLVNLTQGANYVMVGNGKYQGQVQVNALKF